MGRSTETFSKKENEKKRLKKQKEKKEKAEDRKANSDKGKSLDDMMAYVDENGNLTTTPPDPTKRVAIDVNDIQIGVPKQTEQSPEDAIRTGIVSFFNDQKVRAHFHYFSCRFHKGEFSAQLPCFAIIH